MAPIYIELDETHPGAEHYSSLLLAADMPEHCGDPLGGPCAFRGGCTAHRNFGAAARARASNPNGQLERKRSRIEDSLPCGEISGAESAEWEQDADGQHVLFHGVQLQIAWKVIEGLHNKEGQRSLAKKC